jgi:hypothetical protein
MSKRINRQRGQAMTEWTIATFVLIASLFVPWDGHQSAVSMLMDAVRTNHQNSSFTISLP